MALQGKHGGLQGLADTAGPSQVQYTFHEVRDKAEPKHLLLVAIYHYEQKRYKDTLKILGPMVDSKDNRLGKYHFLARYYHASSLYESNHLQKVEERIKSLKPEETIKDEQLVRDWQVNIKALQMHCALSL